MISKKDVEHIARLARIELAEAEKNKFEKDLAGILDFVAKLNEVDTADVAPLAGGTDLANVMREDVGVSSNAGERGRELLKHAPRERDGLLEVKAVFEER